MLVKFSKKGITYMTLLCNGKLIPVDLLIWASGFTSDIPEASNLEAAAYVVSNEFRFKFTGEMFEELSKEAVVNLVKRGVFNNEVINKNYSKNR